MKRSKQSAGHPATRIRARINRRCDLEERSARDPVSGRVVMTLEQIKDGIRNLRPSERIELYRWFDYVVVADCGVATNLCSRIGMDRSFEIREAMEQTMKSILTKGCLHRERQLKVNQSN
jgi:hypothetical protein